MSDARRRAIPLYLGEPNSRRAGVAIDFGAVQRFNRGVDRSGGPEACWPWLGAATSAFGYGRMKVHGRLISPHRIAYVIAHGKLTPDASYHGGVVMHSCDNPACCNPAHLKLASQAENARDMARKGRTSVRRGELSPRSKLTAEIVTAIRESPLSSRKAEAVFGVPSARIREIRRKSRWASPSPHFVGREAGQ